MCCAADVLGPNREHEESNFLARAVVLHLSLLFNALPSSAALFCLLRTPLLGRGSRLASDVAYEQAMENK